MSRFEDYGQREVNPVFRNAVYAIDDDLDFEMLELFLNDGPKSFTELKESLDINSKVAKDRLEKLIKGSLVVNYLQKSTNSRKYSFYDATELASVFLEHLINMEKPTPPVPITGFTWNPTSEIDSFDEDLQNLYVKWNRLKPQRREMLVKNYGL